MLKIKKIIIKQTETVQNKNRKETTDLFCLIPNVGMKIKRKRKRKGRRRFCNNRKQKKQREKLK